MTRSIQDVVINTGEFHFSSGNVRIRTLLGSCVAFTAWHPVRHVGGMCHYLLPAGRSSSETQRHIKGTFADEALEMFEAAFRSCGTQASEYVVKMFGGGSMFPEGFPASGSTHSYAPPGATEPCFDVPSRNVIEGRRMFESKGMVVVAADVGGACSRRVMLDLWSGNVWVRRGS